MSQYDHTLKIRTRAIGEKEQNLNYRTSKLMKSPDQDFAEDYDSGYEQFKIGVFLKKAREEAGLTQEELAE